MNLSACSLAYFRKSGWVDMVYRTISNARKSEGLALSHELIGAALTHPKAYAIRTSILGRVFERIAVHEALR